MTKLLAVLGMVVISASAPAQVIDSGTYFQDTATGQYWLKLMETRGQSYDDVIAKVGYQQELEGWRYATVAELEIFIGNYGIPSQGNVCDIGTYCGEVDAAYAEQLEDLIRLFGDTWDAVLDEANYTQDVSPDGAGMSTGLIEPLASHEIHEWKIQDMEQLYRADGTPFTDPPDTIGADRLFPFTLGSPAWGSFLVRDTDPSIPWSEEPPEPVLNNPLVYDNLDPEEIKLTAGCEFRWSLCDSDFSGWNTTSWEDGQGGYVTDYFGLGMTADFDAQAQPWVRMTSYDVIVRGDGGYCAGGTVLPNGWCRQTLDGPFEFLPPNVPEPGEPTSPGSQYPIFSTYLDYSDYTWCIFCGYSIDNVQLEFISENIIIDFDPWSAANNIRPKDTYFFALQINTTSVADGDAYDFDASTVDPATLSVGPDMAPNVAQTILTADYDNDGDLDYIFAFRMQESGVSCLDTTITVAGRTLSGDPIVGHDTIVPINCEELVDMDVDPWNPANEVRPNDSYIVPVGIMTTSVAAGDAVDIDASQIDPASLKFGPNLVPHNGTVITADLDGDSDNDAVFGFNAYDAGIACGDTELNMEGELYNGLPIIGIDVIETTECTTGACHP